ARDNIRDCTKIFRKICFEAIGGLLASMGWHRRAESSAKEGGRITKLANEAMTEVAIVQTLPEQHLRLLSKPAPSQPMIYRFFRYLPQNNAQEHNDQ
ncbi:MAG TPA: hypothetical protein VLD65_11960, partial [Anaerolineales bacterium]|nr:hypothetical protein [Anaerolineales bacterium]